MNKTSSKCIQHRIITSDWCSHHVITSFEPTETSFQDQLPENTDTICYVWSAQRMNSQTSITIKPLLWNYNMAQLVSHSSVQTIHWATFHINNRACALIHSPLTAVIWQLLKMKPNINTCNGIPLKMIRHKDVSRAFREIDTLDKRACVFWKVPITVTRHVLH